MTRRARALATALALAAGASGSAGAATAASPREHYLLHCSGCHGVDGRGVPGVTPSLHGLARLLDEPGGRAYLGRVPGVAQAPLGDADLAALLNWVLSEFSALSEKTALAEPYLAREIRALRAAPIRDPAAFARDPLLTGAAPAARRVPAPSPAATP